MQVELFIALRGDSYTCLYYDAVLRKKIVAENVVVNTVDVGKLDTMMQSVDWDNKIFSEADADKIDMVVSQLQLLNANAAGKIWAEQLRGYYWSTAGLVKVAPGIAQRFYFFDEKEVISFEEAYRFLSHRWMEKEMLSQKRKVIAVAEEKVKKKKKLNRSNREQD